MKGHRAIMWILTCCFASVTSGCEKDTDTICRNLLDQGVADSNSLQGDWELKYMAETLNGINIFNEETISSDKLFRFEDEIINGGVCNAWIGDYHAYAENSISITVNSITFMLCETDVNELETRLLRAFRNSQCYVIKGDELILHFAGDAHKNVIIMARNQ